MSNGYAGFERLTSKEGVVLAACWAHTRRKFYEVSESTGSPVAAEALRRISELYAVEARSRGQPPTMRLDARRSWSKPVIDAFHPWLERQLAQVPGRSGLAEAIRYALARWEGLTRFLHDGRTELDTNPVERAIRPVAMRRSLCLSSSSICKHWKLVSWHAATTDDLFAQSRQPPVPVADLRHGFDVERPAQPARRGECRP